MKTARESKPDKLLYASDQPVRVGKE